MAKQKLTAEELQGKLDTLNAEYLALQASVNTLEGSELAQAQAEMKKMEAEAEKLEKALAKAKAETDTPAPQSNATPDAPATDEAAESDEVTVSETTLTYKGAKYSFAVKTFQLGRHTYSVAEVLTNIAEHQKTVKALVKAQTNARNQFSNGVLKKI